jgi:hypothetical protein
MKKIEKWEVCMGYFEMDTPKCSKCDELINIDVDTYAKCEKCEIMCKDCADLECLPDFMDDQKDFCPYCHAYWQCDSCYESEKCDDTCPDCIEKYNKENNKLTWFNEQST